MRRKKQHRSVLKGLVNDERTTPDRGLLIEQILKCLDAIDEDTLRMYEMLVMKHIGDVKLVEYYLDKLGNCTDKPVKALLADPDDHIAIQNSRLRDRRSHPNRRFILQIEAMNEDADTEHERLFFMTILMAGCVDIKKHFRLTGTEDEPIVETHLSRADQAAMEQAKQHLNAIMGGFSGSS